jgi:hypothetical protein
MTISAPAPIDSAASLGFLIPPSAINQDCFPSFANSNFSLLHSTIA